MCQQGSTGPGCLNLVTATCHSPLRPSGPFSLSYLHTHTHTYMHNAPMGAGGDSGDGGSWEGNRCQFLHVCFPLCFSPSHLSPSITSSFCHPSVPSFSFFLPHLLPLLYSLLFSTLLTLLLPSARHSSLLHSCHHV